MLTSLVGLSVLFSCKKEKSAETGGNGTGTDTTSAATVPNDKIKDTVLAYTKDIYLWYNQIPASFNARSYADPDKIMTAIRQYSVEPGFSQPVDRWSFAMKQKDWDNLSSGITSDFGLSIFFSQEGDLRVKLVEKDSPAGKAGIRRGWLLCYLY